MTTARMSLDFKAVWLQRFRRNLIAWYGRSARDLPWRRTADPYAIWISEIMLQQTTVTAVVPYFARFLERFPTIQTLAASCEEDVLRQWEGLGYYSRGRNIHRAAKMIAARGGEFPADLEALFALPGIGRYTAGAIASFAFDCRTPIVEANTLRLYTRLLGYRGNPRSAEGQRLLWEFAERVLPQRAPGRFNQALMDLGATVCTPAEPRCDSCPVRSCCRAFAEAAQDKIPADKPRPEIIDVVEASIAIRRRGAYLLRRRGERERWAGLWDFPRFAIGDPAEADLPTRLAKEVAALTGIEARIERPLAEFRHGVTRYRIRLLCFLGNYRRGQPEDAAIHRWVRPQRFGDFPLSVTGRKLARHLAEPTGTK